MRMTRRPAPLIAAALAGGLLLTACGGSDTTAPARLKLAGGGAVEANRDAASSAMLSAPTDYVLAGDLTDLGRAADVYRLAGRPVDDATVRRIAGAFGLPSTGDNRLVTLPDGSTWFGGPDGDAPLAPNGGSVTVFPGGPTPTVSFSTTTVPPDTARSEPGASGSGGGTTGSDPKCGVMDRGTIVECATGPIAIDGTDGIGGDDPVVSPPADGGPDAPDTPNTPTETPDAAEAERIAREVLTAAGALEGDEWDVEVIDSGYGATATVCAGDGLRCVSPPPVVTSRTVGFSPIVDDVTVHGVSWSVTVGGNGAVESAYGDWATIERVGPYDTVGTDAAFADLQAGKAVYPGPQPLMAKGGPADGGAADSGTPVSEPETPTDDAGSGTPPPDGGGASPGDPGVGVPEPKPAPAPAPEPTPLTEPIPVPGAPEPVVVRITGVSAGLMRWDAADAEQPVAYLVPTYRFAVETGGDVEVLALTADEFAVVSPAPPVTVEPQPQPVEPKPMPSDPGLVPEPLPAPATKPAVITPESGR